MQAQGVVLFNSSFVGSSAGQAFAWPGGRSAIVISATQYGPGVIPQIQAINRNWIPLCSSIVADQIFSFDAPPGQYRIISNAGTSIALAASLTITY